MSVSSVPELARTMVLVVAGITILGGVIWLWTFRTDLGTPIRRARLRMIATVAAVSLIPADLLLWGRLPPSVWLVVFMPIAAAAAVLFLWTSRGTPSDRN